MNLQNQLDNAIYLASLFHLGQKDKAGMPYILHPLHLMKSVESYGVDYMIVAVLHDILEDTQCDIPSLQEWCIDEALLDCVVCLSKEPEEDYEAYIVRIGAYHSPIPTIVKMADLEHNSMITRLKGLRKKDFNRMEKYHKAYTYLQDVKDGWE